MKVSKKAEYGIQAVLAIARAPRNKPIQIQQLADSENIPVKFLEQILLTLRKGQLLQSKRGVGGGYQLNRPPDQFSVGDVIRLIDGEFIPIECLGGGHAQSRPTPGTLRCGITEYFAELQKMVDAYFDGHTIEDLLAMEQPGDALAFDI